MTGGPIFWLPFVSSPIEQQPTSVDDNTPAMHPDPHAESPAPVVKSAPPAEAASSALTAISPLEPRLRVHYDGQLHWKEHPELMQRLEDATAALEGAGWTLDRQLAAKGVRLPAGVFNFQPTLYAVMNVSGVSREQLVKHLAPKRLKQRKALEETRARPRARPRARRRGARGALPRIRVAPRDSKVWLGEEAHRQAPDHPPRRQDGLGALGG